MSCVGVLHPAIINYETKTQLFSISLKITCIFLNSYIYYYTYIYIYIYIYIVQSTDTCFAVPHAAHQCCLVQYNII